VLGPYVAGEIPEPLEYTFKDWDLAAVDLSAGFTAKLTWSVNGGDQEEREADVTDPSDGVVTYVWVEGDLDTAGTMRGQITVQNGTNRLSDRFAARVRPPLGGPIPTS
jgi:hypothetical protein